MKMRMIALALFLGFLGLVAPGFVHAAPRLATLRVEGMVCSS